MGDLDPVFGFYGVAHAVGQGLAGVPVAQDGAFFYIDGHGLQVYFPADPFAGGLDAFPGEIVEPDTLGQVDIPIGRSAQGLQHRGDQQTVAEEVLIVDMAHIPVLGIGQVQRPHHGQTGAGAFFRLGIDIGHQAVAELIVEAEDPAGLR